MMTIEASGAIWSTAFGAILTALLSVENIEGTQGPPGWRIHQLTGDRVGTWSISVSGNWRITFKIDNDEIHSLDLEDYR
jgi:proteic killer suppression protein